MRNFTTLIVAAIIVLVLAFYMFFFQVRFDEQAIVTTFAQAEAPRYNAQGELVDAGSLVSEPGFYPKWPWPIQSVMAYSTKVHLLEQELSQLITADNYSVILRTYVTWRIADPYRFFVALRTEERARQVLRPQLQNLLGIISEYDFDQLVNDDPSQLALDEIERRCTAQLQEEMARLNYGIEIEQVGIQRMVLPESTTQRVFERMTSTRETLAAAAIQEGENRATGIRAEAQRIKGQILSFAQNEARSILAEAKERQAEVYALYDENPDLAIFMRQVDTLKQTLPGSTLILDASNLEFLDLIAPGNGTDTQQEADQ